MVTLPTPQQLRYLTALAEHRHFGHAADACAVTQSTLSAGLLALERQMDARIIDRDAGRRVVFTQLGRDLVERARTALAALGAMVDAAEAARAPMSGPLRLGVIPTISPFLLPRLMPLLRAAFPNLQLFLREDTTAHLIDGLTDHRIDAVLLALPCACSSHETLTVARDEFVVALPPGHPLASQQSIAPSSLARERLLLLEDGHCLRDHALNACGLTRADSQSDNSDFSATSLHTLVQMVAGGLGITLLPMIAVAAGITNGTNLTLRPLDPPGAARTLGLAWRPNTPREAEYRALGTIMLESISNPVPVKDSSPLDPCQKR